MQIFADFADLPGESVDLNASGVKIYDTLRDNCFMWNSQSFFSSFFRESVPFTFSSGVLSFYTSGMQGGSFAEPTDFADFADFQKSVNLQNLQICAQGENS